LFYIFLEFNLITLQISVFCDVRIRKTGISIFTDIFVKSRIYENDSFDVKQKYIK